VALAYFGTSIAELAEELAHFGPLDAGSSPTLTAATRAYAREVGRVNAFVRDRLRVDPSSLTEADDPETYETCGLACAYYGYAYLYAVTMPTDDGREQAAMYRKAGDELLATLRIHPGEGGDGAAASGGVTSTATTARRNARANRARKEPKRLDRMLGDKRRPS